MGSVKEEIAKNLLYYRKIKGMTQRELADFLGVNNSAVSNWEKGLNSIDIDTLHKACIALGVSISDMFGAYSNVSNVSFTSNEVTLVFKYRALDQRGKLAVSDTLEREYSYISDLQVDFLVEREAYIKNNARPFAAAGGDSSNLGEAQELYDKANNKGRKDGE